MKKLFTTLSILACLATAHAQETTRYELSVNDFSELKVIDGINVDYVCNADSAGKAVFYATPDMASQILFKPDKTKLEIQLVPVEERVNRALPKVTVYSTYLTYVENDGDSLVRVLTVAPGPKFCARVIGNGRLSVRNLKSSLVEGKLDTGKGTVTLYGTCTDARFSCTGTGMIQADGLEAKNVSAMMFGTGTIGCNPATTLTVKGAGSGTIYYVGKPDVKKKFSPGVKVKPIEEAQ